MSTPTRGTVEGQVATLLASISFVVIILAVTPWDLVWKRYLR